MGVFVKRGGRFKRTARLGMKSSLIRAVTVAAQTASAAGAVITQQCAAIAAALKAADIRLFMTADTFHSGHFPRAPFGLVLTGVCPEERGNIHCSNPLNHALDSNGSFFAPE